MEFSGRLEFDAGVRQDTVTASGRFRFTKELIVHQVETGHAMRLGDWRSRSKGIEGNQ